MKKRELCQTGWPDYRAERGLFRPSQNCSHHYGYGVSLNQITELSETAYRETKVGTIEPKWTRAICAIHTLSHAHRLTVVDANARRARYWKSR